MKHSRKGLTFVELIIVVIILGILATIGTISYTSYIGGSRDANRLTQMSDIQDGLSLMSVSRALPKPENSIDILAGSNVIGFQGYAGAGVLSVIGYQNGGQDPLDDTYFTYYTDVSRKSFQILGFLEEQPQISYLPVEQSYANGIDYSFRFPAVTGNRLGVLVEDATNIPVQEIPSLASGFNVAGTSDTYKAYYTTSEFLRGEGNILSQINPRGSCKRLLDLSRHNGSGVYKINPTGAQEIQVYCDMETDGGGWTFFGHYDITSDDATANGFFESSIGVYSPIREDTDTVYSINASQLNHTEMMMTIDTPNTEEAIRENKIVFWSYPNGHTGFYNGPIPCVGLDSQIFYYKTEPNTDYVLEGTPSSCNSSQWYTRNEDNSGFLALIHGTTNGNYWGLGMGGDNSWQHNGWWYVR